MNHTKEVAKMLGIELNTDFYAIGRDEKKLKCILTGDGLKYRFADGSLQLSNSILTGLITGDYKVEKMPYLPKLGDEYYHPSLYDSTLVMSKTWLNDLWDNNLYNRGLVYRTKEEAQKACEAMLKTIKK